MALEFRPNHRDQGKMMEESLVGRAPNENQQLITLEEISNHEERIANLESEMSSLKARVAKLELVVSCQKAELDKSRQEWSALTEAMKANPVIDMHRKMEEMQMQTGVLQQAVNDAPFACVQVPDPSAYNGARDAEKVENFLFDMDQHFRHYNILDERRRVALAGIYLTGDAKLWWRGKYKEIQDGLVQLETWDHLQNAIRQKFIPKNVEFNAGRKLRILKHNSP